MKVDKIPFLKSKLSVPDAPMRSLFTQRIQDLKIEEGRLVVLVAPAGFGKTTAVLLSLSQRRDRVRWYRMEREDGFLPVFYRHLLETLFAD